MMQKIFLATHNEGKIKRFKELLQYTGIKIKAYTPTELGLKQIEIEENGKTLADNALIKARAYVGKVDMPILANDTGFWIKGRGLVEAPKREALRGTDEKSLTKEEIAQRLIQFWKTVAAQEGGKVDAAWIEAFVVLFPDGSIRSASSRRDVILTDTEFGDSHIQLPVRALYISKTTNKPALHHTKEEELLELKANIDALRAIIIL